MIGKFVKFKYDYVTDNFNTSYKEDEGYIMDKVLSHTHNFGGHPVIEDLYLIHTKKGFISTKPNYILEMLENPLNEDKEV